jgi:membrane-associated phospholipid phosphatase
MVILKTIFGKVLEEVTFLGGLLFYLIISFYFLFKGNYNYFIILILGLFIIYLIALLIRTFHFKTRPKKVPYTNFLEKIDASSFPSIHAARVSFLFIFLSTRVFSSSCLVFLAFILTLLTLYSRIYLKKHYFIDVVGGTLLGLILSAILLVI